MHCAHTHAEEGQEQCKSVAWCVQIRDQQIAERVQREHAFRARPAPKSPCGAGEERTRVPSAPTTTPKPFKFHGGPRSASAIPSAAAQHSAQHARTFAVQGRVSSFARSLRV
jgi:hypothetical protein